MKRIGGKFGKGLAVWMALLLLLGTLPVAAIDEKEKTADNSTIEIAFKVGDSVLSINGEDVEVVTPYVVNGTTLVPLRVISEAFGAQVDWNADTEEVTLQYADVTILLQIGNKAAKVNEQTLPLLEAPELNNGSTMVPLRFITENFGADVTFNSEDDSILVIKEIAVTYSIRDYSSILKRTEKERIGDSYLHWSMDIPKSMSLSYRSFEGQHTSFVDSATESYIDIDYLRTDEEEVPTIDEVMARQKDEYSGTTLVEHKKKAESDGEYTQIVNANDKMKENAEEKM